MATYSLSVDVKAYPDGSVTDYERELALAVVAALADTDATVKGVSVEGDVADITVSGGAGGSDDGARTRDTRW